MDQLIALFDGIVIILAIFVCYYSIKLVDCLNSGFKTGWWTLLPLIFIYALINRFIVFLLAIEILPSGWSEAVSSLQIIFWIGAFIFMIGLYRAATKMICPKEC